MVNVDIEVTFKQKFARFALTDFSFPFNAVSKPSNSWTVKSSKHEDSSHFYSIVLNVESTSLHQSVVNKWNNNARVDLCCLTCSQVKEGATQPEDGGLSAERCPAACPSLHNWAFFLHYNFFALLTRVCFCVQLKSVWTLQSKNDRARRKTLHPPNTPTPTQRRARTHALLDAEQLKWDFTKSQMGDFVSGYNINVCTLKRRSSEALKNTHARTHSRCSMLRV